MKFGVRLPNSGPFASPEALKRMATTAERLGYDAVSVHDHVNWGHSDKYHFYAGSVEAADASDRPYDFYSAFTTLGYIAGVTNRIQLIPTALCLGWRHPLQVAREASTLHQLSHGRFILGVCAGNVKRDFEVTETSWSRRGRLTDESLEILRRTISQDGPISFSGNEFSFSGAVLSPPPRGLDIWYGGTSEPAIRRVARYCDGWMPAGGPEYFREKVPQLQRYASQYGRESTDFEIARLCPSHVADTEADAMRIAGRTLESDSKAEWLKRHDIPDLKTTWLVGTPERITENIEESEDAGVTMTFNAVIGHSLGEVIEQMERFAGEVIATSKHRSPAPQVAE